MVRKRLVGGTSLSVWQPTPVYRVVFVKSAPILVLLCSLVLVKLKTGKRPSSLLSTFPRRRLPSQTFYGHTNAVNHVCCSLKGDMVRMLWVLCSPYTVLAQSAVVLTLLSTLLMLIISIEVTLVVARYDMQLVLANMLSLFYLHRL